MSPTPTRRATAHTIWRPPISERCSAARRGRCRWPCTSPSHLASPAPAAGPFRDLVDRDAEVTPSGNGVDLPDQMRKLAATEQDHQLATGLYRRYVGMLRTAIGVPQA